MRKTNKKLTKTEERDLLLTLEKTDSGVLEHKVEKTENLSSGASATIDYKNREVKCYAVLESEFDQIGSDNWLATSFYSCCAFFFGLIINNSLIPDKNFEFTSFIMLCVIVGIVFLCLGLWLTLRRWKTIKKIKEGQKDLV